ncbi:MAG: hypothetical protein QM736_18625 [Vicinamibacterales bacterium]
MTRPSTWTTARDAPHPQYEEALRPLLPRIDPAPSARRGEIAQIGTATIPAICATAISGMAAKFRTSPAKVTREKRNAPTGISIASTASDATKSVTTALRGRGM